jgi:hypothetical protein
MVGYHFPTITIKKMVKMPFIPDPRYEANSEKQFEVYRKITEDRNLYKNLYLGDYSKDYKSEYVGEYKAEHAQNKVWDTTEGNPKMIVDLCTRLSKEDVLKFRTYSVGAAHIPACILRNV